MYSEAAEDFISDVAAAYRSSPLEATLLLLIILGGIGLLVYYVARENKKYRNERLRRAQEIYADQVASLELTPSWQDALEKMAAYLDEPQEKYLLLENEGLFNRTAAQATADGAVQMDTVSALRVRLGFRKSPNSRISSTASIPEGTTVYLRPSKQDAPVRGTVLAHAPHSFRVEVVSKAPSVTPGRSIEVFYQNAAGIFRISTLVQKREDKLVWLRHSEELSHKQQRLFFRRNYREPVTVKPVQGSFKPLKTTFVDLGGGGASLLNEANEFHVGDILELEFTSGDGQPLRVFAEVLRLSDKGQIAHTKFVSIREQVRDRIYNTIFRTPAKKAKKPGRPIGDEAQSESTPTTPPT